MVMVTTATDMVIRTATDTMEDMVGTEDGDMEGMVVGDIMAGDNGELNYDDLNLFTMFVSKIVSCLLIMDNKQE